MGTMIKQIVGTGARPRSMSRRTIYHQDLSSMCAPKPYLTEFGFRPVDMLDPVGWHIHHGKRHRSTVMRDIVGTRARPRSLSGKTMLHQF